jgi:hypothetical protein
MFKNLKSLFIVEEEDTQKKEEQPGDKKEPFSETKNTNQIVQKVDATIKGGITNTTNPGGAVDTRIWDSLLKAIEDNNQDGFDYLEFKNSLKALASMPMDEATRFKSAFATASTMGVTLVKLVQSVDFYKAILEKEKGQFQEALKTQVDHSVGAKETLVKQLNEEIKKKAEHIALLTKEIDAHKNELEATQTHISEATQKIEITKTNFEITFNTLIHQINDDLNKMNTHLK